MKALIACVSCGRLSPTRTCSTCRPPRAAPQAKPQGRDYRGTAEWRRVRATIWARDCGVCQRCGCEIGDGEPWDAGHVLGHAAGGEWSAENTRVECRACNRGAREG